uniref:Uncharacterized protein n=1 Tax=Schistocephalus solidus TaxID=70667 RepID=A0A0X3NU34_SCHSO
MVSAAARPIDSALSPPGWSTFELRTRSAICPPPCVSPFSAVTAAAVNIGNINSNADPTNTAVRTYLKADPGVSPSSGCPRWSLSPVTPRTSSQLSVPHRGRMRGSNRNSSANCFAFSPSSSSPTFSTSDNEHRRSFRGMKSSTSSSSPASYSQHGSLVGLVTSENLKVICSCASIKCDSINVTPAHSILTDSSQLPTDDFETPSSFCQSRREVENQRVSRRSLLRSFSRNLSWFPFKTSHRSKSPSSPDTNPRLGSKPTDPDVPLLWRAPPQQMEYPNSGCNLPAPSIPLCWNSKTSAVQPPPNRNPFANQVTSPIPRR